MRVVGVDDGSFHSNKKTKQHALLVAVLFRNLQILDCKTGLIEVDGRDANKTLSSLLRGLRYDLVMLSGISFGGFNLVDISKLSKDLRKPVITITGNRPHNQAVRKALRDHFPDWKERWQMVRSAGKVHSFTPLPNEPHVFFEVKGATMLFAKRAIKSTAVISRLPEPIRVARIMAKGLSGLT